MMKYRQTLVLTLSLTVNVCAGATDFDSAVDRLVASCPRIETARSSSNAELLGRKTENNLSDPEIEFEHLWGRSGTKTGGGVSQSFDWPGLYRARSRAMKSATSSAKTAVEAVRSEVRAEITGLLVDMVAARKSVVLLEKITDGYEKMLEAQTAGLKNGSVSVLDVNKVKIELTRNRLALETKRDDLARIIGEIGEISACDEVGSIVAGVDEFPFATVASLDDYRRGLYACDPALMQARAALETDRADLGVARMSRYPGFSVGYAFEREERENYHGFSVGMTLPLFSARGKKAQAEARIVASTQALDAAVKSSEKALMTDYSQLLSLKRQMDEYGPVIENTDNIALLRQAFDSRQISLTSYLQDLNYFLEAGLEYYDLVARYHSLLAGLNRYLSH